MKIIYLCPSLDKTYGWSRYSYDVVTRIAKNAEVVVFCHSVATGVDPSIKQLPVLRSAMTYLSNPLIVLFDAMRIRRLIRKEINTANGDCIVHSTTEAHALFIPFLRGLPVKTILTTHGTYSVLPLRSLKTRWLYRQMYKAVDRVIAVSFYTKKHLLQNATFIPDSKIVVVTNGVDFEQKPILEHKQNDIFTIITVGEVKFRKGAHHLVRVGKILKDVYNFPFRIVCIGKTYPQDKYYKDLVQYIAQNGLEDQVKITGMISQQELDEYYQNANAFALLSVHENGHYEGYPLVFHEAAMWGLPTIGTYDCGAEDAIKDGITGILVDPTDHEHIADRIAALQSNALSILPSTCVDWAKQNSWDTKDLLSMYTL